MLKPRSIPNELKLCAPGKGSTKAEKRRYENACFSAQYQYVPSSTADFTESPNALRLAIEFEAVGGFNPTVYLCSFADYMKTPACILAKVMNSTPGRSFFDASKLIVSPHELHQLLKTWEFVKARIIRSGTGRSYLYLYFRLKLLPEGILRRLPNIQVLRMFLDDYKDVCRFYLAANPQSPFHLAGMIGPPMNPPVATVMAFVASAPSMPTVIPSQEAAAESSGTTIEEVSAEPAAESNSSSAMD